MAAEAGILAFGAYVPQRRLQRAAISAAHAWFAPGLKGLAHGERAVADWDEDSITMAVEAARDCLTGIDRSTIASLSLASTTLPFADRQNSGIVKEALNLSDTVGVLDVTGSQRAATSALIQALNAAAAAGRPQLCLAADRRNSRAASEAELMQGDAAAAVLVGSGDPVARLLGTHSVTVDFVDHFRAAGEPLDYAWESRWIRDEGHIALVGKALSEGLQRFGVSPGEIHHLVIPLPNRGVAEAIARAAGCRPEAVVDNLAGTVGDSGVAHPLLMLANVLESARPREKLLLVGFGQGCDLLLFETSAAIGRMPRRAPVAQSLARRQPDENYLRFLFHRGLLELERGMRAEAEQKQPGTTLYRHRRAVLGLIGSRDTQTGAVQYPPAELSVHTGEPTAGRHEDYPLADRLGRIVSYTADRLAYSPSPPLYHGVIDFEGGGRLVTEFADPDSESIAVGRTVRMVFRIKGIDELRHFTRYYWKAAPVR
ncbi:MAG TPA: OB-fold domain-containing protein [Steroidobacteraceae bacterium]|nr:OB-fold domain-containing protein [Steroidobacteraceae bacterium]